MTICEILVSIWIIYHFGIDLMIPVMEWKEMEKRQLFGLRRYGKGEAKVGRSRKAVRA